MNLFRRLIDRIAPADVTGDSERLDRERAEREAREREIERRLDMLRAQADVVRRERERARNEHRNVD